LNGSLQTRSPGIGEYTCPATGMTALLRNTGALTRGGEIRAGDGGTPAAFVLSPRRLRRLRQRHPDIADPAAVPAVHAHHLRNCSHRSYLRFGRPAFFFGGGGASTFRPNPVALANADLAAAYSAATIG